jgi:hypothetical protein
MVTRTTASGAERYEYDSRGLLRGIGPLGSSSLQLMYEYDGFGRRWQERDLTNGRWVQYYYDIFGRPIEEVSFTGEVLNGKEVYNISDTVYLGPGAREVGRFKRRLEPVCPPGSSCSYTMRDVDINYIHEDHRSAPLAIECRSGGGLCWTGEVDPFGRFRAVGLPGVDGKIGTADDLPFTTDNLRSVLGTAFNPTTNLISSMLGGSSGRTPYATNAMPNLSWASSIEGGSVYAQTNRSRLNDLMSEVGSLMRAGAVIQRRTTRIRSTRLCAMALCMSSSLFRGM